MDTSTNVKTLLSTALREQAKTAEGTFNAEDCAAIATKVLEQLSGPNGKKVKLSSEKKAELTKVFDPRSAQMDCLRRVLEDVIEVDPAIEGQFTLLFDPDGLKQKLQKAKLLQKATPKRAESFKALLALSESQ